MFTFNPDKRLDSFVPSDLVSKRISIVTESPDRKFPRELNEATIIKSPVKVHNF